MGGVLIEGPSGSGKSHLALLLIGLGAELVADDRTILMASAGAPYARAPRAILGLIEARGLGLMRLSARHLAGLRLVVDLAAEPARLPEPRTCTRAGCALPWVAGRADSATARALALALKGAAGGPARAAF